MLTSSKGVKSGFRRLLSCESVSYEEMSALLIPLIAENLFTTGMVVLNSAMVSSYGMATLSAVTLIDTYISMVLHAFQGVSAGVSIIIAQLHGARKNDRMLEAAASSIAIVTLIGTLLSLLSIVFSRGIISLFFGSAEGEVLKIARFYMIGNCLTMPLQAFSTVQLSAMRGVGEGKNALIVTISNSVAYAACNFLFLTVLHMSVTGLLISTGITRAVTVLFCFLVKRNGHSVLNFGIRHILHPDFSFLHRIIFFGFPIAFENLLFDGGRMIIQRIITPLGTNMIAGYNISYNLMTFAQILNNSVNSAFFVAAGMCIGAGRPDDLRAWYRRIFKANTIAYFVITASMLALNRPIIGAFHVAPGMEIHILRCLIIIFIMCVVSHTAGFMTPAILRASGDVKYTTFISILSMWMFRVAGAYVFGRILGLGIEGVCIGMAIDWAFRAVMFTKEYRKGIWEKIHLIE